MNDNNQQKFDLKFREMLMNAFSFTIKFLEENNLNYFAAYGTALGAVRHNDIIPWDDDIDIYMPREDYNKLISMRTKLQLTDYELISIETDEEYYLPFGKICYKNSTVLEFESMNYVMGIYIDIFPLDRTNAPLKEIKRTVKEYSRTACHYMSSHKQYSLKSFIKLALECHPFRILDGINSMLFYKHQHNDLRQTLININPILKDSQGEHLVSTASFMMYDKIIYKRDWFIDFETHKFGDLTIRIPIGYHEYLKMTYGDYMTPPPIEKQVCKHPHFYINLSERLSIEEVRERVTNKEFRKI